MDLEPGPFADREPLPLGPRVVGETTFQSLAGPLVDILGDADPSLGAAADSVGRDVPTDLAASFESTVGVAEEVTGGQFNIGADGTADVLTDRGAGADAYHGAALPYLPQPDAAIEFEFRDPPAPPPSDAHEGPGGGGPETQI